MGGRGGDAGFLSETTSPSRVPHPGVGNNPPTNQDRLSSPGYVGTPSKEYD